MRLSLFYDVGIQMLDHPYILKKVNASCVYLSMQKPTKIQKIQVKLNTGESAGWVAHIYLCLGPKESAKIPLLAEHIILYDMSCYDTTDLFPW